jgi:2-methylcitrate dehydratase PrpD
VLEGSHGFFQAFAPTGAPEFGKLLDGLGREWVMPGIAFKPYACGTMTQPYIDCAVALAGRGVDPGEIVGIVCEVGEGTVHRLWEPLAVKQRPPTPYAAKFSTPFCVAVGLLEQRAGFEQFAESRIQDADVLAVAGKVRYEIDPENPYPDAFTGHLRATLRDGTVHELRQDHMRGGAHAPLMRAELETKFLDNARYGGWDGAERLRDLLAGLFAAPDLKGLAEFRQ